MNTVHCPALLITAPSSGQGKTTVTAALARYHRKQGRKVRVFKTGPDFLDPMILQQASGAPVYQLDLWMVGEEQCRHLLYKAACEADLILIEGVMGFYDGQPSTADLARYFNIPAAAVINAKGMGQSFGALAHGLANFEDVPFAGVLANQTASENHLAMIRESIPEHLKFFGALPRENFCELPSRHLGLVQAGELLDLDIQLDQMAEAIAQSALSDLPDSVGFEPGAVTRYEASLRGQRIAVARDEAFSFVYQANLDLLHELGAELIFFSPLHDKHLPEVNSLYLPGGYPELHLQRLQQNYTLRTDIITHHQLGKPVFAECGGMLYLLDSLCDQDGTGGDMLGIIPGNAQMQKRLTNLGMHAIELPWGKFRGHSYHHSSTQTGIEPVAFSTPQSKRGKAEPFFEIGNTRASYLHLYLSSNPAAVVNLFTPTTVNREKTLCI